MLRVAFDRHDVNGFWFVGMHGDREAEIARQIAADFVPQIAGVVAAHHIPVLLHEEHIRTGGVHGEVVNAVTNLGGRIRKFE